MEAILARRSIRKYTDQPVSDEQVTDLLRAAMAAPSAYNQQPWQFVVVRDRAVARGSGGRSAILGHGSRCPSGHRHLRGSQPGEGSGVLGAGLRGGY